MACCYYEDCGDYSVTPMLIAPCLPMNRCEDQVCLPCLPGCDRPQVMYCCEKPRPRRRSPVCCEHRDDDEDCCPPPPRREKTCHTPRQTPSYSNPPVNCSTCCKPVKTKYVIPCYRYEDGRIVKELPVSAFKRNGMQDQEHSKLLGTANFLVRHPQDVAINCHICPTRVKKADPAKVPCEEKRALGSCLFNKKPIEVSLEDILDD